MLPCHNTCEEYRHKMCREYYSGHCNNVGGCKYCDGFVMEWPKVRQWAARRNVTIEKCSTCKETNPMVPSEPSDKVRMQLTVNVKKDGTVVLPVAGEIEYLTAITGQDYRRVYFDPILLGNDCVLKYNKKLGGWKLIARKKQEEINL